MPRPRTPYTEPTRTTMATSAATDGAAWSRQVPICGGGRGGALGTGKDRRFVVHDGVGSGGAAGAASDRTLPVNGIDGGIALNIARHVFDGERFAVPLPSAERFASGKAQLMAMAAGRRALRLSMSAG